MMIVVLMVVMMLMEDEANPPANWCCAVAPSAVPAKDARGRHVKCLGKMPQLPRKRLLYFSWGIPSLLRNTCLCRTKGVVKTIQTHP